VHYVACRQSIYDATNYNTHVLKKIIGLVFFLVAGGHLDVQAPCFGAPEPPAVTPLDSGIALSIYRIFGYFKTRVLGPLLKLVPGYWVAVC